MKLAFTAGEKHLCITKGSVNTSNIASGLEDPRLKSYLHQCKLIYQQLKKGRSEKQNTSVSREKKRSRSPSMEEVFESLRTSVNTGNLESREAAKIASRSYEGLKLKRVNAEGQGKSEQGAPSHQPSNVPQTTSVAPARPPLRSISTSQIPTHPAPPHHHSSKRPLSEIYVGGGRGGSSFSDLSTTRTDLRPAPKYERSQSKEDRGHFHSNQLGHTQYGLHRSMDSGMAATISRNTATPTSFGSSWNTPSGTTLSGYESDSLTNPLSKPSSLSQGTSLPRSFSHSGLSAPTPTPPPPPSTTTLLNKSLTRSTESFNQPTFDLPGGRTGPRRAGSYARLDSTTVDELSTQVADLQERVGVLSLQLLYEKADLYKQLRRTCEWRWEGGGGGSVGEGEGEKCGVRKGGGSIGRDGTMHRLLAVVVCMYCCCLLLLFTVVVYCCCLLLLLIVVVYCCCLLLVLLCSGEGAQEAEGSGEETNTPGEDSPADSAALRQLFHQTC